MSMNYLEYTHQGGNSPILAFFGLVGVIDTGGERGHKITANTPKIAKSKLTEIYCWLANTANGHYLANTFILTQ